MDTSGRNSTEINQMMKNKEFHIPFLKNLILIALVTIVSMGFAHYFISNRFFSPSNSSVFTSAQSQNSVESP